MKRGARKDIAFFAVIIAVIAAVILNNDIKTPEQYYAEQEQRTESGIGSVTLTVQCTEVVNERGYGSDLPADGIFFQDESFVLTEGESVFGVIKQALDSKRLTFDYNILPGGGAVYINGIAGLYEFDFGPESGWYYTVNGTAPDINCGAFIPSPGDEIELCYINHYYGGRGQ
ncbi:MAG: DUF4430 domain-containing protein [Ruminococcus sp.]|nr:DUF4430 domain-containing protein [Ruminococcus sp.]